MSGHLFSAFLRVNNVDWTKTEQKDNTNIYKTKEGKIICIQVCDNKSCTYTITDANGKTLNLN